ncbi:MAG TPA: TIGR02996 domain-containing protein [Gemmataceae bacterium]|nr:TIGR02996 domain-containing protein [Gemmataceae bacterium]
MRDDQDFLNAILDSPEDTGLRLVYADWLEEHGDPDRAEFIRVECARDQLSRNDPRWDELDDRARALEKRHAKRWFGPIAKLVEHYGTRCGFVEEIELTTTRFVKNAATIFALQPVRDVFVTRHHTHLRAFGQCPQLAKVTRLGFCDANADEPDKPVYPLGREGARFLAMSPYLGNVRELTLWHNRLGPNGFGTIVTIPELSRLVMLEAQSNDIGRYGAEMLAYAKHLTALEELNLSRNAIGDDGVAALAGASQLERFAAGRQTQ